jgi:hypothetical protein
VTVGPVLDADGVAVTGGVVGDFKISKDGGAPAALNGSATATHRHTGFYSLALTASDLDTVGTAEITIDDTVNSMAMKEISVVEEAVYDALFAASANAFTGAAGSSALTALASGAISEASFATTAGSFAPLGIIDQGTAQSATSTGLVLRAGASFADNVLRNCVVAVYGSTQGYWQAPRIITANALSGDSVTVDPAWEVTPSGTIEYKIYGAPADLSTPPAVNVTQISGDSAAADNLEAVLDGTGGVTLVADLTGNIDGAVSVASALGSGSVNADALAADAVSEIWSAGTRTLTAGTNIVLAKGTGITGFNDLSAAQVESEVNDALVALHLDHLLATDYDPASKPGVATALLNELVESDGGVARFTTNALEQGPGGGGSGSFPGTADEWTALKTILGVPASGTTPEDPTAGILDTIRDDTSELQTDWANGGRLDLLLDAVLADTGTDGVVLSSSTLNAIADALLDRAAGVETNRTPRQALRLILAAAAGKSSGAGTGTVTYRDTNDTVNRIVATATDGNRTAVTLNAS